MKLKTDEFQKWVLTLVASLVIALVSLVAVVLSRSGVQPAHVPVLRIELLLNPVK